MVLQRTAALPCTPPLARLGVDHGIELSLEAVDLCRARTRLARASVSRSKQCRHNKEYEADGTTSTGSLSKPAFSRHHCDGSPPSCGSTHVLGLWHKRG